MLFSNLEIKGGLLRGIEQAGFVEPTPIQAKVIPLALAGKNILGQSQTGTGKTLAFLIPLLNKIDTNLVETQALIMAPTRELVSQIYDDIYSITNFYRVPSCPLYGGVSQVNQVTQLKRNPRIIISTPGRLQDLLDQGLIDLSKIKYFVVDEIDRLMDMGFMPTIKRIRGNLPSLQQSLCFSATMNDKLDKVFTHYMGKYEFLKSGTAPIVEKISHGYILLSNEEKFPTLRSILKSHKKQKVLIFTNTISGGEKLYNNLLLDGYDAGFLNGDMKQSKRNSTTDAYINGQLSILVTTDVAARGLNLQDVQLVINYDVPSDADSYVHRIGRTARAGAFGKAIMFVTNKEKKLLEKIEITHTIILEQSPIKAVQAPVNEIDQIESKPRKSSRSRPKRGELSDKPKFKDKSFNPRENKFAKSKKNFGKKRNKK